MLCFDYSTNKPRVQIAKAGIKKEGIEFSCEVVDGKQISVRGDKWQEQINTSQERVDGNVSHIHFLD